MSLHGECAGIRAEAMKACFRAIDDALDTSRGSADRASSGKSPELDLHLFKFT